MLAATTSPVPQAGPSPADDKLVEQVTAMILKRIADDKLVIPALPVTINKCMQLVREQDYELGELAGLIEREPMVAASVLRTANSAAYASVGGKISSLKTALTRLGTKGARKLVMEVAAEKMFVSRDKDIAAEASKVWRHSLAVAIASRDMRALNGATDFDDAYLAGLLHDIGKPVVAGMLLVAEQQIVEGRGSRWINARQWAQVVQRTHRTVGLAIAEKWQMPAQVISAIRDCSDFDPSNRQSLANTVCFANALAKQCGISTQCDKAEAETLVMIGKSMLGVDDGLVTKLISSLENRVADMDLK